MLQYITDNKCSRTVEDQIKDVLEAGGKWIEIDTDGISDIRVKEIVTAVMPLCIEKEAFLVLKDKVDLAKEINVGGVVLSQGSDFPSHARASLGAAAVIGVMVNSTSQIAALNGLDVDFVMFAPYKAIPGCDAQPLGIDVIKELCAYMETSGSELPRVAAGGVAFEDIKPLMEAGCNGVAMSESLADAPDLKEAVEDAINLLKVFEKKEEDNI